MQILALFSHLYSHNKELHYLVVAPISTLYQWETEICKWCPFLKYVVVKDLKSGITNSAEFNVILTTYHVA